MAYQAKDAVFLVLLLVCLNVIYNRVTTDAVTIGTSTTDINTTDINTTDINTTPNPWNISCISDNSSVEESLSSGDHLSYSSMHSDLENVSSFSNLKQSEHSSISYTTCILLNSDYSRSSDLITSEYFSIPYSATLLSSSGTLFLPKASFSVLSETVFQSWTDKLLQSSEQSPFSNNFTDSENSSTPYSETILTSSDIFMSSFTLRPSHSISSEESSQAWFDHLSNSTMFLSTQDYSLISNLIGSQYSSIQHTTTDLEKDSSSCILESCDTSVHILPTSAHSATYSISSLPSSTLPSEVSPSFISITDIPFSSSQSSAHSSFTLTNLVTGPTSSKPTSTLPSYVSQFFKSTTNIPFSSSQMSAHSSFTLTTLVTRPTSSTPTSTLPSDVSQSFKSATNTPFSSSQRSAHSSFTLTTLVTRPTSSTPTSTLPSDVSPSFNSTTNTPFSSSQTSAIASVSLTSLVTAPTSSTPTKQQTTSTVGETVIYPTFKPLAVYEFTFVFILDGDFASLKTSNEQSKLKKELEQQLLEKIFKNTELREVHVSNFSNGSIACHTLCSGQVQNVTDVVRNLKVILKNTIANAKSINTSFGACDEKKTTTNITSSINTYTVDPEKYVQYNCPKSYNYNTQDRECHHACEDKGIGFCGSKGECVFSGTENVAVCQCSEESLYIYHGDKCEQKTPKLTFYLAVSLGAGGGVVIILLITIICVACRRIKLKKTLKAADDDSEEWSLPNEHVAMKNLSFRLSKKPANLYYRPTGQMNKAYESIAPDEVIMPMYFPPKHNSINSRHEDDIESRRESLKNIDTSQKYSIRRPKVSMEPNDLYHSVKAGPRI